MIRTFARMCLVSLILPIAVFGGMLEQNAIDKMLEELATSDIPVFNQRPKAFRDFHPSGGKSFEYCCPDCGEKTLYVDDTVGMRAILKSLRKDVVNFRAMGLDVGLDEHALCRKCSSLVMPVCGEVVALPDSQEERNRFPWRLGDKLEIHSRGGGCVWFEPCDKEFWIWGEYVSNDGQITCSKNPQYRVDIANVRMHPDTESTVIDYLREGDKVIRCPLDPESSKGWVRVLLQRRGIKTTLGGDVYDFMLPEKLVGNYRFPEGAETRLCPGRIRGLAWLYAGRRVVIIARERDTAILYAFLKGRKTYSVWEHGQIQPLKKQLPRLRQILQGKDYVVPEIIIRGKIREHGTLSKVR